MRVIRGLFIFIILTVTLICVDNAQATWWVGGQRLTAANGITALISTPPSPLDLIEIGQSGVSSWVQTLYVDENGTDWMEAGWKISHWYSTPKQFVEWCIDCRGELGTYRMEDGFAIQDWGTTIDYWVYRNINSRWCAYTAFIQRFCEDNLHPNPVQVNAQSEVHDTPMNPLDTTFDQVRYKDPVDNVWRLFDDQVNWRMDFPYDLQIFSNSHFRTYRLTLSNYIYLPTVIH